MHKCYFGNRCIIRSANRNRCKACRLRKCLEVGMSFQKIKMGRIPIAEKCMILAKRMSDIRNNDNI